MSVAIRSELPQEMRVPVRHVEAPKAALLHQFNTACPSATLDKSVSHKDMTRDDADLSVRLVLNTNDLSRFVMKKKYTLVVIGLCSGLLLTNAEARDSTAKTAVGGAAGGAAGAAIGKSIGGSTGKVIGGALGGATGAAVTTKGKGKTEAAVGGAVGGAVGAKAGGVGGAAVGAGAGGALGRQLGK